MFVNEPRGITRLLVLTGAGISAGAGIPTFRSGEDATWSQSDPGVVAEYRTWRTNREAVHRFHNARRIALRDFHPTQDHHALARWQRRWDAKLVTQNVDDLLERAGCRDVLHLHGESTSMYCTLCGARWHVGYRAWDWRSEECAGCGSVDAVKPGSVFFHEPAPLYRGMLSDIGGAERGDAIVVAGTSCEVLPFHSMLVGNPAWRVFCSLDPEGEIGRDGMDIFDLVLPMPFAEAVPRLEEELARRIGSGRPEDIEGVAEAAPTGAWQRLRSLLRR